MSPLRTLTGQPVTDSRELAAVIAEIVRDDERWDQGNWFSHSWFRQDNEVEVTKARASLSTGCGATACVSGWAVILAAPAGSKIDTHDTVELPNGNVVFASTYGGEALHLDDNRANWLFEGTRSQGEVLYALDNIAAGQSWSPEDAPDEVEDDEPDYYDEDD